MAITEAFKEAAEKNDVLFVRISLKDSLVRDPTFVEFDEKMNYKEEIPGLFDPHDGEELNYDKSVWSKDYLDEQLAKIIFNFSKERLDLLKQICKHLYKDRIERIEEKREAESKSNAKLPQKKVGAGLVAVGVTAAVVGVVASEAILAVAGVAGVIAGGVMILTDK